MILYPYDFLDCCPSAWYRYCADAGDDDDRRCVHDVHVVVGAAAACYYVNVSDVNDLNTRRNIDRFDGRMNLEGVGWADYAAVDTSLH